MRIRRISTVGVLAGVALVSGPVLVRSAVWADAGVTIDPAEVRTVLPRDAIRAIDEPAFVSVADPAAAMTDDERVLGLTINGDARAYPINVLSVHEIVNDVVGGRPVAVTW